VSNQPVKSGYHSLVPGSNGLPKVVLAAPDGAQAEIYLHGGHVTSWVPAGGEERLFLSCTSEFSPQASIRGGVPVIFPQFGKEGPLPRHGFVRRMEWKFLRAEAGADCVTAVFQVGDDEVTRRILPHAFVAELAVTVGGQQLELALTVTNPGEAAFSFTGALHTYLSVAEISDVSLLGLAELPYLDTVGVRTWRVQQEEELLIRGEVDRIYYNAPHKLTLHEKGRQLGILTDGLPDVVVWNPWVELGATLADLEPEGYRRMLCVEAVVTGQPVTLAPGESWQGIQRLTA
jgi:glucose-6-phosphate 1-epimerase